MEAFPNDQGGGGGDNGRPSTGLLWFIAWYRKYKPESTYDTWMQPYRDVVAGYTPVGHRLYDWALAQAGVNVTGLVQWLVKPNGKRVMFRIINHLSYWAVGFGCVF
ncbi:hypothetical protein B0T18DRAFT_163457 [Schizothecium vesticola]|uniref:Uncharacterized protein n=1 Tax=Schizothecium vesticola TaxID=314040 RepID=A0AA40K5S7_9PEZI|nr:hypothetical protein B0T18DRAFT_163457 [Schizothecium vesticola]